MDLADRMKLYESIYAQQKLIPKIPMFARLDGKAFHTWTKKLNTPYDSNLINLFIETTKYLVKETSAKIAYTQSDEITLMFYTENNETQLFFDQRIQKVNSVLASMTTAKFNQMVPEFLPEKKGVLALFDCRVWSVPNLDEAANVFLWRELDATKNSITMAAQSCYSHKELHKKNGTEKQEMLFQKGINWNDYPPEFKRGSFIRKINKEVLINGNKAIRSFYERLDLPPLKSIENRPKILFENF